MKLVNESEVIWEAPPTLKRGFNGISAHGMVKGMDKILRLIPHILASPNQWAVLDVVNQKEDSMPGIYNSPKQRRHQLMKLQPLVVTEEQARSIKTTTRTEEDGSTKIYISYIQP